MKPQRCAIYCRVSTPEQDIESQKTELPKYAQSQGWEVADTYIDEGISGSFIEGRSDFLRLVDDMEQRRFDTLLVVEHSRVTRTEDPEERGRILRLLRDNGIKLASPAEGVLDLSLFSGELMTTLKLMFAAEEKLEIQRRFKRGRDEKLRQGTYCLNSVPYGLRKIVDKTVTPKKHDVVIDENEAQVLRTVHDRIVNKGKTINDCTYYLNQMGVKTRKGKTWTVGGLSSVLSNEGLKGTIYTGRYVFKTVATNPQRQKLVQVKPKSESIPVQVPAVFTEQEFKLLRQRIEANKRSNMIKKDGYLLRGKLRCSQCGAKFVPVSGGNSRYKVVRYYCCHNRKKSPKRLKSGERRCTAPYVNAQLIDGMIENELFAKLFMFPEQTLKDWSDTDKGHKIKLDQLSRKLAQVNKDIEAKHKEEKRLLGNFVQGSFSEDTIKTIKEETDAQLRLAEDQKSSIQKELDQGEALRANMKALEENAQEIRKLTRHLYQKLISMPFFDKQRLLQHFITGHIEILPLPLNEVRYAKMDGTARKVKCEWEYWYSGILDIGGVVKALREYDKTNVIPEAYAHYTNIRYLQCDPGDQ